ncbi:hypothetical protein CWS72_24165 [Telmatospirillum siberiense]|uniref:HNH nuclease domain-containing protein n=1 Tax=Telmatospirillum siberiense TaxID=382514 RepID=A0A2N3PNL2_9PROT|nr:hypothetical protein CWS72_24165 [Telmatospirillum siberiense]
MLLSASRETWRLADDEHEAADERYRRIKPAILKRDGHVCQYCGFRCARYQECHHLSGDHADNRPENLVTICFFCHMTFHVGRTGNAISGEAQLVWYPELGQTALNHEARAVYIALQYGDDALREVARSVLASMQERSSLLTGSDYLGTQDGSVLGEALLRLSPKDYARRAETLAGVRLFPMGRKLLGGVDRFREILDFWVSDHGPYHRLQPDGWRAIYDALQPRPPSSAN